jgi:predicted dehydrogenase
VVIGSGKISEEHLAFLRDSDSAELAALCDLSPALARHSATRFGSSQWFTDYRLMLQRIRPDVVHVLTPPHTHMQLVADCLRSPAHVIVEKPIAPTHSEFLELWSLAEAQQRLLIEDHNYRFNGPVQELEAIVQGGELGVVQEVEVRISLDVRSSGGRYADRNLPHPSHKLPAGVIHEFITHLCYLALRFAPGPHEFKRVCAAWDNHPQGEHDPFRFDDLDALVDCNGVRLRLRFSAMTGPDSFSVIVRGQRGYAEAELFLPHVRRIVPRKGLGPLAGIVALWSSGTALRRAAVTAIKDKVLRQRSYEGLHRFLSLTYAALCQGTAPPVTFDDMDSAARLVDALVSETPR